MRILTLTLIAISLVAASCGGGGDETEDSAATPAPTIDAINPNTFSAVVLGPDDIVQKELVGRAFLNPQRNVSQTLTTQYGDTPLLITSSVGRMLDRAQRDEAYERFRIAFSDLAGTESNYALAESDQAFIYRSDPGDIPIQVLMAMRGDYFMILQMQSNDESRGAEALDSAVMDQYAQLVWGRLVGYLNDPSSLTPIPGAPTFPEVAAETPSTTETPSETPGPAEGTPAS